MAAALAAALLAALLAVAGTVGPAGRVRRSTGGVDGADEAAGADGAARTEMTQAEVEAAAQAEAEAAGVPAWRDLWYSSLEALRREPSINSTDEEVLVQLGAAAFLHCPVRHLGERGVSWVRRRDWHIISSGVFLYTNDERFQVLHSEGSDDWILQIKYVQQRDNGTYECQVSTARGTLARRVHVRVAVPEAFILGADEHHVDAGSDISLVCIVEQAPAPPQYVFWFHNARMINYDAARGVSVHTAPGARTQSALRIRGAAPAHSGDYSCRAPNARPAHVSVYVSEGSDKMAATLSRSAGCARAARRSLLAAALAAAVRRAL